MALALSINSLDYSIYVRVSPGEGLDPFDSDMLEYGMTDNPGIEGPSLLSVLAGAREMVFPLHVTPTKTANYPDTKQGLHNQIRDINANLKNAGGTRLAWQDEGATDPTYYNVIAARFESDYSFRRHQKLWATGTLRVWTAPYGHTGTYRSLGAAAGTGAGVAFAVPHGSIAGDVPAWARYVVTAGSFPPPFAGRALGVAVVPSGYSWDIPVGSLVAGDVAGSVADPAGLGSYSLGIAATAVATWFDGGWTDFAIMGLSPATMYEGRNRILAIARGPYEFAAFTDENVMIGYGAASAVTSPGHNTLDLGVLDVTPQPGQATAAVNIKVRYPTNEPWDATPYGGSYPKGALNRLLVLPDDAMALSIDTRHRLLSWDPVDPTLGATFGVSPTVDALGNQLALSSPGKFFAANASYSDNFADRLVVGSINGLGQGAKLIPLHDRQMDMAIKMAFRLQTLPNTAAQVGKSLGTSYDYGGGYAELVTINGSVGALALYGHPAFGVISSVAVAPFPTYGVLQTRFAGPRLDAVVRNMQGTVIATAVASHWTIARPGFTLLAIQGTGFVVATAAGHSAILGWVSELIPSQPRNISDGIVLKSEDNSGWLNSSASVFLRSLDQTIRGVIPNIVPTIAQRVVGLSLPIGYGGRTVDEVDVDIQVLERWRYAR